MALLVGGFVTGSSAQVVPGLPDVVGQWTEPFEEGGAGVPFCSESDGRMVCKPVGYASAVLPDGRNFYFNGIEGSENIKNGYVPELGYQLRNSRARIMDLRSGTPQWTIPTPDDGGGVNPDIKPGDKGSNPFGVLGVPGRPGDGPVGSTVGQVAPQEPKSDPDDAAANDSDMFCGDVTLLGDGRLLIAGGTDAYSEPDGLQRDDPMNPTGADMGMLEVVGVRSTRIFDYRTNSFAQAGHMKFARWYPAMVTLGDGRVMIASGVVKLIKSTQGGNVRRVEIFDPATNAWTEQPDSDNSFPLLTRLFLMPNGKVFYNGTGQGNNPLGQDVTSATWALQQFFDPQSGTWEFAGPAPLGARGTAMELMLPLEAPYDQATILSFGGTLGPTPSGFIATPFSTLSTVTADGGVINKMTGNLNHARWFSSGVLLPDGQVLSVNGADKDELHSPGFEVPIKTPELYNPGTGKWTEVANQTRDRTYHTSAILLPDMRVLVGGHSPAGAMYGRQADTGGPFANNDKDPSFEIWSPPYLFRGARPSISSVPSAVRWGESFPITSPDAADIESVRLMRLPSAEHTIDSDQRTVMLEFERSGNTLMAVAPPNGNVAPPGPYYLVVNRKSEKGPIPSMARIVFVGDASDPSPALQPFADGHGTSAGSANQPHDSGYFSSAPSMFSEAVEQASTAPGAMPNRLEGVTTSTTRPAVPLLPAVAAAVAGVTLFSGTRRFRRRDET